MSKENDYSVMRIKESIEVINEMRNSMGRFSAKEMIALHWANACLQHSLDEYEKEGNT